MDRDFDIVYHGNGVDGFWGTFVPSAGFKYSATWEINTPAQLEGTMKYLRERFGRRFLEAYPDIVAYQRYLDWEWHVSRFVDLPSRNLTGASGSDIL